MSGPKHLWSGNWEEESTDPPREVIRPSPPPRAEMPIRRPRRDFRRTLIAALATLLVVAVALAMVLPGGSTSHHHGGSSAGLVPTPKPRTIPTTGPPTPLTSITGHTVNWLGMQISTVQGAGVVIQTVQLGSPADAAGLDPGDVIESVNHHSIATASQIISAVAGLGPNQVVNITVERGSTTFMTAAVVRGHPTTSP